MHINDLKGEGGSFNSYISSIFFTNSYIFDLAATFKHIVCKISALKADVTLSISSPIFLRFSSHCRFPPSLLDVNAEAEEGMVATSFAGKIRNIQRIVDILQAKQKAVVTTKALFQHANRNGPVAGFAQGTLGRDLSIARSLHPETLKVLEDSEQYTELEDLHAALLEHTGLTLPRVEEGNDRDKIKLDIGAARWGGGNPNNPKAKPGNGKFAWASASTWYPSLFDKTKQTVALQTDIALYALRGFLTCGAKVKAKGNKKLAGREGLSAMVKPNRGWKTLPERHKAIDDKYARLGKLNKLTGYTDIAMASKAACYNAAAIVHSPRWEITATDGYATTEYDSAVAVLSLLDLGLKVAEEKEIQRQDKLTNDAKAASDKKEAEEAKAKLIVEREAEKKTLEKALSRKQKRRWTWRSRRNETRSKPSCQVRRY
jgi:hypothetical protein